MDKRKNNKGGRTLGSENKSKAYARDLIDSIALKRYGKEGFGHVIEKMFELVDGVTVQKTYKDGETVVYTEKPDSFAGKLLMEYRLGKAPQPMEHTGNVQFSGVEITIKK
jgi:hypothetical protein